MSAIKIAHVKAAGTEFVFVPLAAEVARLATAEQGAVFAQVREICHSAGLAGVVVPVWRGANGLAFLADNKLQPLLARLSLFRVNLLTTPALIRQTFSTVCVRSTPLLRESGGAST